MAEIWNSEKPPKTAAKSSSKGVPTAALSVVLFQKMMGKLIFVDVYIPSDVLHPH